MAGKKEQTPKAASRRKAEHEAPAASRKTAARGGKTEARPQPARKSTAKKAPARSRKESPLERKEWGYDPLLGLESIKTTMSGLLADLFTKRGAASPDLPWEPPIDLYEIDNHLVMEMMLPGASKQDVQMHAYHNLLIISGESRPPADRPAEKFHFHERRWGAFHRSIPLPFMIRPEAIRASLRDGILSVTMPLESKKQGKSVQIQID